MSNIRPICNDSPLDVLLNTTFAGPIRSGYVEVGQDKTCLVKYFENYAERIKNFQVRDEDVYLFGFPKSGTTLLGELIWLLRNNLDYKSGREAKAGFRVHQLELVSLFDVELINKAVGHVMFKDTHFDELSDLPNPRCFKSHLHWSLLPQLIQDDVKKPKIVVIVRRPEDVCISHYHYSKQVEGYTGTFEQFCELFLGGRVCFGPYWKQVLSLWEHRDRPNILCLKFKDVIKNIPGCVRKVAQFLNKDLTEEQILELAEHLSFKSMKENPSFNYTDVKFVTDDFEFFRSGQVGEYKTRMSPEMLERFEEWNLAHIAGTGFDNV